MARRQEGQVRLFLRTRAGKERAIVKQPAIGLPDPPTDPKSMRPNLRERRSGGTHRGVPAGHPEDRQVPEQNHHRLLSGLVAPPPPAAPRWGAAGCVQGAYGVDRGCENVSTQPPTPGLGLQLRFWQQSLCPAGPSDCRVPEVRCHHRLNRDHCPSVPTVRGPGCENTRAHVPEYGEHLHVLHTTAPSRTAASPEQPCGHTEATNVHTFV